MLGNLNAIHKDQSGKRDKKWRGAINEELIEKVAFEKWPEENEGVRH